MAEYGETQKHKGKFISIPVFKLIFTDIYLPYILSHPVMDQSKICLVCSNLAASLSAHYLLGPKSAMFPALDQSDVQ